MVFSVYCDVADFLSNVAANIETASLYGLQTLTSTSSVAGATSLTLNSVAGAPSGTFTAWILDGLNSETVQGTVSGSALLIAAGTVANHAAGVNVVSGGALGSLPDMVVRASRMIENYCRQGPDVGVDRSLYAISRTETYRGPTFRTAWDPDYQLLIRTPRWPVLSVSSALIQFGANPAIGLQASSALIVNGGKMVIIPYLIATPALLSSTLVPIIGQRAAGYTLTLTYIAGACLTAGLSSVPDDVREAAHLFIADIAAQRQNPEGVSEDQVGKSHRIVRHRGDQWTSMFREHAYELLSPYAVNGDIGSIDP